MAGILWLSYVLMCLSSDLYIAYFHTTYCLLSFDAGDLHIGHALNKILKDFIVKYQLLRGQRVSYIPGWDCHGLPIEMKVLQRLKSKEVRTH